MIKKCCRCEEEKDISMFYRSKCKRDGRQSHCKKCHDIANHKYRLKYPEKSKKWNKRQRTKKRAVESKIRSRKNRQEMTDYYIRDVITMNSNLNHEDIPDEMVKLHRINLQIKRKLKLTRELKGEED